MEKYDQQPTLVSFNIHDETEFPILWCDICMKELAPTVDDEGVEVINITNGVDQNSRCKA